MQKKNVLPPKILKDFFIYLGTIKGKSENTITAYQCDLTLFFKFLKRSKEEVPVGVSFEGISIENLTIDFIKSIELGDIYEFLSFLEKERGNGALARGRKVATIRSFYKYLHNRAKLLETNITLDLETPKVKKRNPMYLNLQESKLLLRSIEKCSIQRNKERDLCIVLFFLNCGFRLSELCGITLDKIKGDTLTVIGKGDRERTIYLNEVCQNALKRYLEVREAIPGSKKIEHLFLSERVQPIAKRTVERVVRKYMVESELNTKYSPHKLRHSAATLLYKYGKVDIRSLQHILGHGNISTTTIYTHLDDEKLREAINSNPLNKSALESKLEGK